mmetsp:Transcript_22744/g.79496  ORF Transcript_22744/g.79496 Transcript_22744/m.79496 type:complete len:385 (-) Transcript_22744:105-1259(-)
MARVALSTVFVSLGVAWVVLAAAAMAARPTALPQVPRVADAPTPLTYKGFTQESYQDMSRADKMSYLWNNVIGNTTSGSWPPGNVFDWIMEPDHSMKPTVDWEGDEMPPGRLKSLHSIGAVAQARVVLNGAYNYTGLFEVGGMDTMLLRMAAVWRPCSGCGNCPPNPLPSYPHYPQCDLTDNFNPTAAFKVLRDGVPSGNFFGMQNILADGSWNPFHNNISTRMPRVLVGGGEVTAKFHSVTDWGFAVGTSGLATHRADGTKVDVPVFPYQLIMYPRNEVHSAFPDEYSGDPYRYLEQVSSLEAGTVLWDLWAKESPSAHKQYLGYIELVTQFTTSAYGDGVLFYKHDVFENDIAIGGDRVAHWIKECPTEADCPVCPFEYECF